MSHCELSRIDQTDKTSRESSTLRNRAGTWEWTKSEIWGTDGGPIPLICRGTGEENWATSDRLKQDT